MGRRRDCLCFQYRTCPVFVPPFLFPVVVFLLIVQFVAPVLIMPLFNKYIPLADGELKSVLETYIHAEHFTMRGLFTMDGSRRSTHSNAFFTGFGRFRRIVLFDTLIQKHTVPELLTVVCARWGITKNATCSTTSS